MSDSEVEVNANATRVGSMPTHKAICEAVRQVADEFALTKVSCFGSYADGRATKESDLDILVEFAEEDVSVWTLCGLGISLEKLLKIPVDVIHAPIPEDSMFRYPKICTGV
ncbi:MAG: nucleotidyltransferase domain-containing protein [Holophagales bacterium]|jgi:predicted nucleotidyltransferase|nr:nucleotidyltransferase domain-containing protein [Holophagales bacterium]